MDQDDPTHPRAETRELKLWDPFSNLTRRDPLRKLRGRRIIPKTV